MALPLKSLLRHAALAVPPIRAALDKRDAEIARLKAELARVDAAKPEGFPPGHFYSVLPDVDSVRLQHDFQRQRKEVPGVDLRPKAQLALLKEALREYDDMPFPVEDDGKALFFHRNGFFGFLDAFMTNTVMRKYRPRRIIEVGSGFSSALMMSVDRLHLGSSVQFTLSKRMRLNAYAYEWIARVRPRSRSPTAAFKTSS